MGVEERGHGDEKEGQEEVGASEGRRGRRRRRRGSRRRRRVIWCRSMWRRKRARRRPTPPEPPPSSSSSSSPSSPLSFSATAPEAPCAPAPRPPATLLRFLLLGPEQITTRPPVGLPEPQRVRPPVLSKSPTQQASRCCCRRRRRSPSYPCQARGTAETSRKSRKPSSGAVGLERLRISRRSISLPAVRHGTVKAGRDTFCRMMRGSGESNHARDRKGRPATEQRIMLVCSTLSRCT